MLAALPAVNRAEVRGDRVLLHTTDSDAVARRLLTETSATDLEVASLGLEDAFLALTSDATPDLATPHLPAKTHEMSHR